MPASPRRDDGSEDEIDDILRDAARVLRVVPPAPAAGVEPDEGTIDPEPPDPFAEPVVIPAPVRTDPEHLQQILSDLTPPPADSGIAGPQRRPVDLRVLIGVAAALAVVDTLLGLWSASRPLKPQSPPPETSYASTSARWTVLLTRQRVDAFWREHHHLPVSLAELGYPGTGMLTYERDSEESYRISVPGPGGLVVFDSRHPDGEAPGEGAPESPGPGGLNP